jgi:hypothetical protein
MRWRCPGSIRPGLQTLGTATASKVAQARKWRFTMQLATQFHRSLVSLGVFAALALVVATQGEAAEGKDLRGNRVLASCPAQAGVDATDALVETRGAAASATTATPPRRIDWRAMLPAVTLRGRA